MIWALTSRVNANKRVLPACCEQAAVSAEGDGRNGLRMLREDLRGLHGGRLEDHTPIFMVPAPGAGRETDSNRHSEVVLQPPAPEEPAEANLVPARAREHTAAEVGGLLQAVEHGQQEVLRRQRPHHRDGRTDSDE